MDEGVVFAVGERAFCLVKRTEKGELVDMGLSPCKITGL